VAAESRGSDQGWVVQDAGTFWETGSRWGKHLPLPPPSGRVFWVALPRAKALGCSVRPFHGQRIRGSASLPTSHLSPPRLYTSSLHLPDELIVICHAVLVLSENANIKRSKRSLKRKDVTGDAKRKSLLELLINNGQKPGRLRSRRRQKGKGLKRKVNWVQGPRYRPNRKQNMGTILLIIIILLLIGALPTWPYSSGWGYYPTGGLGLVFIILLVLVLLGRI
jgi:Protein of unknown function (DUF3309)